MRRLSILAAGLALVSLGLAGCSESGSRAEAAGAPEATSRAEVPAPAAAVPAVASTPDAPATGSAGPAFAETYPGAEIEQATRGEADGTDGGLMVFTTEAAPGQVIAFYKGKAEVAGLAPTMAMAQGDTHAYGAAHPQTGATLSVVASPDGDRTSVQLSWSGAAAP
jgi:hypothetical protein